MYKSGSMDLSQYNSQYKYKVLIPTLLTLAVISKIVFDNVYLTSENIIDEEFHLDQGLQYCEFKFNSWNPKITTLPGLYLISTVLCGFSNNCSIYCLRLTSYFGAILNLLLFYKILCSYNKSNSYTNILSAVNISILPPLYFFSHLYYTDVVSLSTVLLMLYFSLERSHILAALFGAVSIIMRQTNVIWVLMIAGQYVLSTIVHYSLPKKRELTESVHVNMLPKMKMQGLQTAMRRLPARFWLNFIAYGCIIGAFILFVLNNGSIVIGDKSAHTAQVHVPQLFYLSLFCLFFGLPHLVYYIKVFLQLLHNQKYLVSLFLILIVLTIHLNTLIHPYLLADNRHFTFYLWNRLFQYSSIRLLMAPIYFFALFVTLASFYNPANIFAVVTYIPCVIICLCLQKMIEVRYFIIPFVLWRLQLRNVKTISLIVEFVMFVIINTVTIKIFVEKEIYWSDFKAAQRLIW